jgi:hypothetical protein
MRHANRKDWTGTRFGHLVAISDTGKSSRGRSAIWLFQCDCGRQREIPINYVQDQMQSGYAARCDGCRKDDFDITGDVYGSLTALREVAKINSNRAGALWEFQCICGEIVCRYARDVRAQAREGHTPSCGKVECGAGHNPTRDYTGEKFGKLTAIKPRSDRSGMWLFQCDCGAAVERKIADTIGSVRDGYTPACKACIIESKRQFNQVDFTGQRFGLLVALRPTDHYRGNNLMWIFRCDCGSEVERVPADVGSIVKRGQRPACPTCRQPSHKLPGDLAIIHRIWNQYRAGARIRGLEFSLTDEDVRILVTGNCFYCGAEPSRYFKRGPKSNSLLVNGIDRMDNRIGYVHGNVVSCCWACNKAKMDTPYEDWIAWINRIASYQTRG